MKVNQSTAFTPDNLVAGNFFTLIEPVTISAETPLSRGAVLGRITTGGKYTLAVSSVSDGSQIPIAILAEDIESGESVEALVYTTGIFAIPALTFGQGITPEVAKDILHTRSIFLTDMI